MVDETHSTKKLQEGILLFPLFASTFLSLAVAPFMTRPCYWAVLIQPRTAIKLTEAKFPGLVVDTVLITQGMHTVPAQLAQNHNIFG